jgi:hypothetical protein
MMRLKILFTGIFIFMVAITIRTSLESNLFAVLPGMLNHPWTVATLWDAYLGFLTFYIWVAYKEAGLFSRILWFFLIIALGNISMSFYVLVQLFRLPNQASFESLLLQRKEPLS